MRTPSDPRLTHLPALDGLRALAVVLVIVYHLDVGVFPGGFLGVDLFFVISGFLITTLLLREHDAEGRIALGAFWVRRFRRLVPLLVVVVAATVAATRWWGVPEQWSAVRGDAVGALAYIANWRFIAAEQSYFDTVLGPSPLLHTWSLGVEEQWYLLWPLVMVGLGALASSRWGRWAVLAMLVAGIATSAALMAAWFDPADPSRVYYGTETRAQHLLVGAALAWLLHVRPNVLELAARRPARPMATLALAALVGVAAVTPDETTWLYRGGLLGISLVAAVVVWAVALPADRSPLGWLASPTLVWLGRRSYGLYLWHWPVIVFVGPGIGLPDSGASLVVARMAVLLVLAEAGHRLVETPARRARPPSLRPVLAWSAAAVATVVVAGAVLAPVGGRELATTTVIRPDAPVAERVAEARSVPEPPVATAVGPPTGDRAARPDPVPSGPAPVPTSSSPPIPPAAVGAGAATGAGPLDPATVRPRTVLILGDSTALVFALEAAELSPRAWDLQAFARLGCAITAGDTVDAGRDTPTDHEEECRDWRTDWAVAVDSVRPDAVVVMVGAWEVLDHRVGDTTIRFPSPAWSAHVREALQAAARTAGAAGAPVAFTTLPCMEQPSHALVSAEARNDVARVDAFNAIVREVVANQPHAEVLDLASLLCPGGEPLRRTDGEVVRYDGVHVSPNGAELVWDWMTTELDRLAPVTVVR